MSFLSLNLSNLSTELVGNLTSSAFAVLASKTNPTSGIIDSPDKPSETHPQTRIYWWCLMRCSCWYNGAKSMNWLGTVCHIPKRRYSNRDYCQNMAKYWWKILFFWGSIFLRYFAITEQISSPSIYAILPMTITYPLNMLRNRPWSVCKE